MRRSSSRLLLLAAALSLGLSGCFGPYIHTPDHFHTDELEGYRGHYRPPAP